MHIGGVAAWLREARPELPVYLVHADDDKQDAVYPETASLIPLTYPGTGMRNPALMFLSRGQKTLHVKIPTDPKRNVLIAGSHFVPDVMPLVFNARKAPGATKVAYIHHIVQEMPRPKSLHTTIANLQEKFCFSLIKKHFDKIITVNQSVVDSLRARGFEQPILLSTNFVNAHQTPSVPYADKDVTVIFVGRLVKQKGIDDFLDICEKLQPQIPKFKAVMVGVGPEADRLKTRIQKAKLNVELTGFVNDRQKFDLLSRAKLFVFPSIEEGWGIVIAESLSVGTPVLAYDLPVYNEPFGGHIQTVPLHNNQQLLARAEQLLAQYQADQDSYGQMQAALVQHASNFSRDHVAAKEFDFIMEEARA